MNNIPLTQGKVAIVDDDDYPELSKFKWYAIKQRCGNWYAVRQIPTGLEDPRQKHIYMHLIIIGSRLGMETDHINGNGLDNRKENLRIVTRRENCQNKHSPKTSKYPGVSWDNERGKWLAQIIHNGKKYHIGRFLLERDAIDAYTKICNDIKNPHWGKRQ